MSSSKIAEDRCLATLYRDTAHNSTRPPYAISDSPFLLSASTIGYHTIHRVFPLLFNSYSPKSKRQIHSASSFLQGRCIRPVRIKIALASSSEMQLGSLIQSYGFASLRYAVAGGMRSFQPPSPLYWSLARRFHEREQTLLW